MVVARSEKQLERRQLRATRLRVKRIVRNLTGRNVARQEQARQELSVLPEEILLLTAQRLYGQYDWGNSQKRGFRTYVYIIFPMFCIPFLLPLLYGPQNVTLLGMPVTLILAACLYRYMIQVNCRNTLGAMACVLQELREVRQVPMSLTMLTSRIDPVLAGQMKLRCPELERLLPGIEATLLDTSNMTDEEMTYRRKDLVLRLRAPFLNVRQTLETLKMLEQIGDETAIPTIQELCLMRKQALVAQMPLEAPEDVQVVQKAAQECLEAMRKRNDVMERTLLRGSEDTRSDTLLRPVETIGDRTRPDELLRPQLETIRKMP